MTDKRLKGGLALTPLLLTLLLYFPSPAKAVDIAGKIKGTVTDQSGGVVPAAMVIARNSETGVETKVTSGSDGTYSFESLLAGVYTVSCERPGFKRFVTTDIRVISQQSTTLNITLTLGEVTQSVEVTAAGTLVDTSTPTIQSTLGRTTLEALPVSGRDVRYNAELIQPGAVAGESESGVGIIRVNGIRGSVNNYRVDGTEINDYFHGTPAPFPAAENLQEFTVLTNSYGAQYGTAGGSQVSAIIKSGTNDLHGAGWAYFVNSAWNANSWQANRTHTPRPSSTQRWWGGNVGGPVFIPRVYDGRNKTFFFASYEYTHPSLGTLIQQKVPTVAERAGDFTDSSFGVPMIDGVPTPVLNPADFSPMAKAILANTSLLPTSSSPDGTYNWTAKTDDTTKTLIVKIDHQFGAKHRLFGTLYWYRDLPIFDSQWAGVFTTPYQMPAGGTSSFKKYLQSWTFNDTYNITPNILNNVIFGIKKFENSVARVKIDDSLDYTKLGVPGIQVDTGGAPTLVGIGVNAWGPNGFTLWGNYDDLQKERDIFIADNFTWIKGRHTIQVGYEQRMHNQTKLQNWGTAGYYWFASYQNGSTGNPFADFLLGRGATFQQWSLLDAKLNYPSRELYAQDQIKVSRKLTTIIGLRWSPFYGVTEDNNHLNAFRPGQQSTQYPHAPLGLVVPGDQGIPAATYPNRYRNFAPRVGIAFDPRGNGKMVIRAGYGIYYDFLYLKGFNEFASTPPYGLFYSPPGPVSVTDPYGGVTLFPYKVPQPGTSEAQNFIFPPKPLTLLSFNPDFNAGRIHQWNVGYEWEPFKNYLFTVAYVGTRGTHLRSSTNLNVPLFIPGASTDANQQSRRPYPQFQDIIDIFSSSNSWYNSMQISLNKRFSRGFSILGNYVYSKNTDDGDSVGRGFSVGPYRDPRNRRIDYGPSNFDVRHTLSVTYNWELPFVPRANKWTKLAFGNWVWGGTLRAVSGYPITIGGPNYFNHFSSVSAWANYVGGPIYGDHSSRASQADNWLNPNAFCPANATGPDCTVDPAVGVTTMALGDSERGMARGPGGFYNDMTLGKRFPFSERWGTLEFRVAAFNVFNHTVLYGPDSNIANKGSTFGKIFTAAPPRTVQLAIRYLF
jgi:hypothetical protein